MVGQQVNAALIEIRNYIAYANTVKRPWWRLYIWSGRPFKRMDQWRDHRIEEAINKGLKN